MRFHTCAIFTLSVFIFSATVASAREPESLSGKGMPTKLGLLYLDGGRPSEHLPALLDGGHVPIMKVPFGEFAGPDGIGFRLKKANPRAIIVVGIGAQSGEMKIDRDPAEVYADWARRQEGALRTLAAHKDKVDYLSFMPNMWQPKTVEQAEWYCRYIARAAPRIAEMGFRPVILQCGVGNLPTDPKILDAMVPALRIARKLGGAWAYHGYTIQYTTDPDHERSYSLRHRQAYDYLRKAHPDVADLTMILMEGGVDKAGDPDKDGWQARGSKEKFVEWLEWFDAELLKDPEVLGVCLFKIGNKDSWKSFDLDPVAPWLDNYLKEKHQKEKQRKSKSESKSQ